MKIRIVTILLFGLLTINLNAQDQREAMMASAENYNKALMSKDYGAIVNYTIPSVVKMAGGEEYMLEVVKTQMKSHEDMKMTIESLSPQPPNVIDVAGNDLHAIMPQIAVLHLGDDKVKRLVYYLASSADLGKTWTFLDLEAYDEESLKMFVPNFTGELKIPAPDTGVLLKK